MICIIRNCRIFDLEIMSGTPIFVRNFCTGRQIVSRLSFVQGYAQSDIGIVFVCTLVKLDTRQAHHIIGRIPGLGAFNYDIEAFICICVAN